MTHGRPERVGSIGQVTAAIELKLIGEHGRDLLLTGATVAGDALLDLAGGVLGDLEPLTDGGGHADALGAAEFKHRLGVLAEKRRFDGHDGGRMLYDHLGEAAVDELQPLGVVFELGELEHAELDNAAATGVYLDYGKPEHDGAGVDADDAVGCGSGQGEGVRGG